jgi:regulator of RNase E activity RraA
LFLTEASRKNLSGLIVDGPIRDMNIVSKSKTMCFSSSITPYSGTVQSLGETQVSIKCGGVDILPGDIIIGDVDGVVAGNLETMAEILDVAEHIT